MAAAKRVLRYLCSTSGMGLVLGGRRPVVLTGHADASWADDQATQRSSKGYTFSLGSGSVSWRSTRSSSVLSSSCEAEIYAGAMAAQELRWLTYLLTDLGEQPRSPPVLYVDNKAMLALCREHRLEHRTKHIALRYFLPRELQQCGQLRLDYVASEANTADIFTKALAPGDHQRFCTILCGDFVIHPELALLYLTGLVTSCFPTFLPFDPEGRPVAFDTWHDDLQLYLLSDSRDSVSLFDHVSGAAPAPPATADVSTRSQWLSRDATARLAIRNHLPATECAHFGKHRTAQALYDTLVARYSSPATAAIGRLLLPCLFPEKSAFATIADLVTHLRTSDARYRATIPAEFLAKTQPPMFITLYFVVTRLPDSLRSFRDHFLTLDPTSLTVDLLAQHLLTSETSAVAVGAARGTPRSPFFEGCSPSPLSSSFASAAAAAVSVPRTSVLLRLVQSAAAARERVAGVVEEAAVVVEVAVGVAVGAAVEEADAVEVVAVVGPVADVEALVAAVEAAEGVAAVEAVGPVVVGLDLSVEALVVVGASSSSVGARLRRPSSSVSGWLSVGRVRVVRPARMSFAWVPVWAGHAGGFTLSAAALPTLTTPGALSLVMTSSALAERSCLAVAALDASASGTPPGTAPPQALHTFTLDSGASRCFFRLHLLSFSTNLVSTAALQDAMVTTTTPGGQRVSIWTCTRTGRHLATFTRRPGSSLYTLATEPPHVAAAAQVSASGQVAASCSCRLLSHQTLLWDHRLGHPSLPRLRGMHSRLLVSGLPKSLPPLPPSPAPPCLPCVEGRQRAAPHSSSFPPTTAPLQTLHMDVWGPARVSGQGRERYFLLVVDDYMRYTTIFPLRSKGEVSAVLIPWIRTVHLQLCKRFGQDLPVLRLHSDRGGEFSSDLLRDFCRGEGILQSFMLPDSPQQNGIAERRIGLVIEFYHPTSRRVLPSQDVTFDESVPFYRLFPYRSAPSPPAPLFLAPGPPPVDPLPPQGLSPSRVSQVDPLSGIAPVQVAVVSGAAPNPTSGGAASGGAEPGGAGSEGAGSGGAEPEGVEHGGAESEGAEHGGAESEGAESGGAEPRGAASSGAPGAGEPGDARAGGAAVITGARDPTEPRAAGAGDAGAERREPASRPVSPVRTARRAPRSRPPLVPGTHAMELRPSSVPLRVPLPAPLESSLLEDLDPESDRARAASPTVARLLATAVTDPSFESAAAFALVAELLNFAAARRPDYASALVAESVPPSPPSVGGECALGTDVLEDRHEDFECLAAAVPRFASLLLAPEGDSDAPDIPTPRSYAEANTGPYSSQWQAAMDAEMASWKSSGTYVDEVPPPGVNIVDGMWIFRVKQPPGSPSAFKARYVARGFSQRQGVDYFQTFFPTPKMTTLRVLLHVAAQRDYELHSLDFNTAFLQGSLHEEILLRRPPGFTGSFPTGTQWSLRQPVYGLGQAPREWHDTLRTTLAALGFVPSTADPSLFLRTDTSLPPFYVLVYVDDLVFATADTEPLTLVLQRFGFQYSSPQLTPLSTSHLISAPPSDESVEPSGPYPELVGCLITSGMGLVLGGRGPVVLTGHADASWVDDSATQRSSQGYTFSLVPGSVSWRSTRSSSVLSSSYEAEIYAGAMAAQELHWLIYLLTDLGEQPRSPPILYVENKAMIALCQEHRLEHRTKHIALRYFLLKSCSSVVSFV
ncbi:unnamed protein product [Closterium sp. NIES-54]